MYCSGIQTQSFHYSFGYKHVTQVIQSFLPSKTPPPTATQAWALSLLNGFLLPEEPTSSAFLALSTSSTSLTWSTMASLQTLSLPSWHDGLRFRRSSRVPFSWNFLRSLLRNLLEAGGGALLFPHVGAGHQIDQNETRQSVINISLKKIKRIDWVITFEHIPPLSVPDHLLAASAQPGMFAASKSTP